MEDNTFRYNEEHKTYFANKQLKNGYVARIYFYVYELPPNKFGLRSARDVSLAIAKSKKDLNNWMFQKRTNSVNDTSQFKEFGISVLVWAKKMIYKFGEENRGCITVGATNNKRYRVYKYMLKDFKESSYNNQRFLYKIF